MYGVEHYAAALFTPLHFTVDNTVHFFQDLL
jgi:hypothetical protein